MNQLASCYFNTDGRVTWVEIEGIPLQMWSKNTFNRVASKWSVLLDVDDHKDEHFHRKRICKVFWVRAKEVPGWIPDFVKDNDEEKDSEIGSYEEVPNREDVTNVEDLEGDSDREIVPDTKFEEDFPNQKGEEDSVRQGHFKNSEVPKSDGSILQLIDDLVKVGETMDYFIMVRGDWMPNDKKLLINSVYAPQELSEKKMLWDCLSLVMSKWEGEEKSHKSKRSLLAELADCRAIIDKGEWENKVVNRRTEVVNLLQEIEKKNSLEAAQKAKIKWAIEGDEKSKYYHGVINKKRNPLSIRGILVERTWIDFPSLVKIQWCKKKNKQSLVFKVDFEKALRSSRGSVIVNGSPTEEFQFYKGLKQGDPLSHFLFILVMERLHISFQRVVDVEDDKVKQAAAKIGCNTLKTPFSYLGSKVGGCMSLIQSWNETIERMACQSSKWKLKALSIGGRLTLLKYVVGSMPIFKVPKKVLHRMESMRSHFFSGAELSSKKSVWVK
nr:RNA-directed DNA polymerase, eukaryota [Tanacetum cinerariifolium]